MGLKLYAKAALRRNVVPADVQRDVVVAGFNPSDLVGLRRRGSGRHCEWQGGCAVASRFAPVPVAFYPHRTVFVPVLRMAAKESELLPKRSTVR